MEAFLVRVGTYRHSHANTTAERNKLMQSLVVLQGELEAMDQTSRLRLKMRNDISLRSAISLIRSLFSEARFRKLYTEVFERLLGYGGLRFRATEIFEQFVKGITCFNGDIPAGDEYSPLYHRPKSCGSKNAGRDQYKRTHTCKIEAPVSGAKGVAQYLKKNKKRVMHCLVERMIYDGIFMRLSLQFPSRGDETSMQNVGHVNMLEDVRRDFRTCFPNLELDVHLRFDENDLPVEVTTTLTTSNMRKNVETQTYVRNTIQNATCYDSMYHPDVFCKRTANGKEMYKRQTFFVPQGAWRVDDSGEREEMFAKSSPVVAYNSENITSSRFG
jgi:hypothetical protein